MKTKYGFLSAAFVAASVLLGSQEASAGGGAWWGRAGYAALRVRELHACIDDYTAELRVAFRAPGARGLANGGDFVVSADLWGDALCTFLRPGPVALPLPPPVVVEPCGAGFLPPPLLPPVLLPPPLLPPPLVAVTEVAYIDGFATYNELASCGGGNWHYADFDLFPLVATICGPGHIEDLQIDHATIYIDGRPFVLAAGLPHCGDNWYDGGW